MSVIVVNLTMWRKPYWVWNKPDTFSKMSRFVEFTSSTAWQQIIINTLICVHAYVNYHIIHTHIVSGHDRLAAYASNHFIVLMLHWLPEFKVIHIYHFWTVNSKKWSQSYFKIEMTIDAGYGMGANFTPCINSIFFCERGGVIFWNAVATRFHWINESLNHRNKVCNS